MPDRILRAGILDSDRVDQLDAPAEVFYRRLMSIVDDHGLFDARPSLLRSKCYPVRKTLRETDIPHWLAACQKAGLIALYTHEGKPFGKMLDTKWKARSEPKYPLPPTEIICSQQIATVPVVVGVVVDEVVVPPAADADRIEPKAKATKLAEDWTVPADWVTEAKAKYPGVDCAREAERFASHHKAKGSKFERWKQAWWSWCNSPYQKSQPASDAPGGGRVRLK